jgi:sugar diacid utilization regulator
MEFPGARTSSANESSPAELSAWLDAIAEITRGVHRGAQLGELLDLIAGATARLTGYDFCAVLVEDPGRGALMIEGSYGLSQAYIDTINAENPIPIRPHDTGEGPSSRAFRSQRPTTLFDIAGDAPSRSWEAVAAQQGYSSLLSVPLVVGQLPFGLLNCYTAEKHHFPAREIVLMESMANQAGLAIETARRLSGALADAVAFADESARYRAQLEALAQADADHRELLRIVLKGGGLTAIAQVLSETLSCAVVVDDPTGRLLAMASGGVHSGATGDQVIAAYQQAKTRSQAASESPLLEVSPQPPQSGESHELAFPVVLDEQIAARLWVLCPRVPFSESSRQALVRAATVVAFALLKERTAQEVEWRLSRDFFEDLLDAEGQADEALLARGRQLDADLTAAHTLLVIRRDATPRGIELARGNRETFEQRSLLSLVQRLSASSHARTLTATRSDHVVVLWRHEEQHRSPLKFAELLRREINAYGGGATATIAVGPTCVAVGEYGDAYGFTCGVLDLVQQSGRRDRVVALGDIGAYRLLLQVKRPRELEAFAQSVLGPVHAYDRQHRSQLISTLRAFLTERCNLTRTAKALHVHVNTVTYRLHRIEAVLSVHLDGPQALLDVQLAFMIEDILGDAVVGGVH